ncbi:hypothetical protein POV27_16305 [Aureisphaera galaxeae]|uniref:hypothetical protein n=1 Tax=Aureisphaera galaxeae TaxID=1538023 RepID=UPI002350B45C|nr:hypothetical protein [Aureisphaera galaxeae]MDC8005623.1 hypothetical protein [Aureisphaera galaxeae]
MRGLRLLFDFYINASIHVALAVTSLFFLTLREYEIPYSTVLVSIVFFGTISGYNFIKYARIAGLHHRSLATSLKTIQVFSFLCASVLLYFLIQLPKEQWIPLLLLGVFTFLYAVPFLRRKSLRTLHGIKIFVVGWVWAGVTVLFPLWETPWLNEMDAWLSFLQIFLLVIVWTLPFEIRDIEYDAPSLGTLPQKLGVRNTKLLGMLFLALVLVAEVFKHEITTSRLLGLFFVAFLSALLLGISQKKQSKYFASFLVESIPIVWVILDYTLERLLG